jgi:hypothetical protein
MVVWFPGYSAYDYEPTMKYHAPEYDDDSSGDSHGSGDRREMAGDCPSQLSDERWYHVPLSAHCVDDRLAASTATALLPQFPNFLAYVTIVFTS